MTSLRRSAFVVAALMVLSGALLSARTTPAPADPVVGNPKAAVHVVMYEDLECPKCALFHQALKDQIIPEFGSRVAFEFRDFHIGSHPWSYNAALIARYLDTKSVTLGMDWRDYCFTHQDSIEPGELLDRAAAFCAPHGITRDELASAFSRPDLFAELQRDQQLGEQAHLTGTPFILVNGVALPDSAMPPDLIAAIKSALARSK